MATRRKSIRKLSKTAARLNQRKQEELLGILLLVLGFFTFLALFSYDPGGEPERLNIATSTNVIGFAGVIIAHALIHWTIGYPVVILPFILVLWGINRLFNRETAGLVRFTLLSLSLAFFVSLSFALHDAIVSRPNQPQFLFSGKLGGLGAQVLVAFFGLYGAVVVLIGMILAAVLMASTFTFSQVYDRVSRTAIAIVLGIRKWSAGWWLSLKSRAPRKAPVKRSFQQPEPQEPTINRFREKPPAEIPPEAGKPAAHKARLDQLKLELEEENPPRAKPAVPAAEESSITVISTGEYELPHLELLQDKPETEYEISDEELQANANLLEAKLADFGIEVTVAEIHPGPVITRYELELAPGIKVSRITALADDLAMAMRAQRIRIVAPIPGKSTIGVEIPNLEPELVYLREILMSPEFQKSESPLTLAFGKTISGQPFVTDLAKMPHLLVAGSTGSGKSVCLNTIIASLLFKAKPDEVQIVLIDPKRLELSTYAKLWKHHLNYVDGQPEKVATTAKSATAILKSLEQEMENRYELLAAAGVRNIQEYNERVREGAIRSFDPEAPPPKPLVYLVLIVDELADLMLTATATKDVEEPIARLTQMSRAVGIHLVLATQRPSVDVITGVIKANFPARIAFQVASKVDSRTILDMNGAEKLLGRGDMLFLPPARPEPIRLHNAFISLKEIERIIDHIRSQPPVDKKPLPAYTDEEEMGMVGFERGKRDPLFKDAMNLVVRHQQGSVSLIQRRLKVGYSRAARLIDELEDAGVVGPFEGSKAREVLVTPEELESLLLDEENEDFD